MDENVFGPATGIGVVEMARKASPLPSWNLSSLPQQNAAPDGLNPHAWFPPAVTRDNDTAVRDAAPMTSAGAAEVPPVATPLPS
jgi:hypothetical protein